MSTPCLPCATPSAMIAGLTSGSKPRLPHWHGHVQLDWRTSKHASRERPNTSFLPGCAFCFRMLLIPSHPSPNPLLNPLAWLMAVQPPIIPGNGPLWLVQRTLHNNDGYPVVRGKRHMCAESDPGKEEGGRSRKSV
jgi:hypothetical protein